MNVKTHTRNLRETQDLRKLIDRQCRKVRRFLPTFASQDIDLNIDIERHSKKNQFHVSISLALPQKALHCEDTEYNLTPAVLKAFSELIRRIKRFKSKLNREKHWQRDLKLHAPPPSEQSRPDVFDEYQDGLEKIENYLRRELYHRVVTQDLPPGLLQPHELVDEVYLKVTSNPAGRPENVSPDQYMFQVARRTLGEKVQELREAAATRHVEEPTDGTPQWEDEDLNFYQPDESLKLEDLLTDKKAATPEEYLREEETEELLQKAIAALPKELREPFVLYSLEGFNSHEVAMIMDKTREEVLDAVDQARQTLRGEMQVSRT
ncbi:MAG TPA: sigma-70 family RNA polymerase sigma factor [Acidobacteriota bacterium]|nr:sigma-70 family RNA polymerase sigma factor [Acidobacteriota bacterium]